MLFFHHRNHQFLQKNGVFPGFFGGFRPPVLYAVMLMGDMTLTQDNLGRARSLAGEPPSVTKIFHSGSNTERRGGGKR